MLAITAGALLRSNVGRHKEPFRFPPRVSHSVRATVEAFARAYEEASRDRELHHDNRGRERPSAVVIAFDGPRRARSQLFAPRVK